MHNHKVIILGGYAGGGTKILWDILQSHPRICSSVIETGQLFKRSPSLFGLWALPGAYALGPVRRFVDDLLFDHKMSNLENEDARFITEGVEYTREQVADSALCMQSVDEDVNLTDKLRKVYPGLYFIGLTRNGYVLCDGHLRRGRPAASAGKSYQRLADQMRRLAEDLPRFKLVKFEDVISKPFEVAEDCYRFLDMEPVMIEKLRLKAEEEPTEDGVRDVASGDGNYKGWFSRDTISSFLPAGIDTDLRSRLKPEDAEAFEAEAQNALMYYGYV